jgi:capsular exopolysaccharide synthesis family protein
VEANLQLSTAQGVPKSLAVTSTRPGEGKSTTAIALARSLARARRQVVLVDADLRSPSIHSAFGLQNISGVSDLLTGGGDCEAVLQRTEQKGLWVIAAGSEPANPVDLLIGEPLARLVKELRDRFDHVIIDGPSVIGRADASLIAAAVQGVVYAVEAGSPAGAIRKGLGQLHGAPVVGGVLTKVREGG